MSKAPPNDAAEPASASLQRAMYRYFFYGWMFRDAGSGSLLERAAALRHNRSHARWLPTYLRRWTVAGGLLLAAGAWAERSLASAVPAAMLWVALVLVVVFIVVTIVCWTALRFAR